MKIVIETQRLLLREFTKSDGQLIFDLNSDPEVIQYTFDPIQDLLHAQEVLEEVIISQYRLYNYGRWAIHLKTNNQFAGWCGLKYRPEKEEVDLGYRLMKRYWGCGYATEAAIACISYGFEQPGMKRIIGRATPGNKASIRVLEKCGMRFKGEEIVDNHPALTYEIQNPLIR